MSAFALHRTTISAGAGRIHEAEHKEDAQFDEKKAHQRILNKDAGQASLPRYSKWLQQNSPWALGWALGLNNVREGAGEAWLATKHTWKHISSSLENAKRSDIADWRAFPMESLDAVLSTLADKKFWEHCGNACTEAIIALAKGLTIYGTYLWASRLLGHNEVPETVLSPRAEYIVENYPLIAVAGVGLPITAALAPSALALVKSALPLVENLLTPTAPKVVIIALATEVATKFAATNAIKDYLMPSPSSAMTAIVITGLYALLTNLYAYNRSNKEIGNNAFSVLGELYGALNRGTLRELYGALRDNRDVLGELHGALEGLHEVPEIAQAASSRVLEVGAYLAKPLGITLAVARGIDILQNNPEVVAKVGELSKDALNLALEDPLPACFIALAAIAAAFGVKEYIQTHKSSFSPSIDSSWFEATSDNFRTVKRKCGKAMRSLHKLPGVSTVVQASSVLLTGFGAATSAATDMGLLSSANPKSLRGLVELPGKAIYSAAKPLAKGVASLAMHHPITAASYGGAVFMTILAAINGLKGEKRRYGRASKQLLAASGLALIPSLMNKTAFWKGFEQSASDLLRSISSNPMGATATSLKVTSAGIGVFALRDLYEGNWRAGAKKVFYAGVPLLASLGINRFISG